MKDVPAFREEPYTTSINNYVARLGFQFISFNLIGLHLNSSLPNWRLMAATMLKSDRFGADLYADNSWLDKDMEGITMGAADDEAKAKKIYSYVRDHFACKPHVQDAARA